MNFYTILHLAVLVLGLLLNVEAMFMQDLMISIITIIAVMSALITFPTKKVNVHLRWNFAISALLVLSGLTIIAFDTGGSGWIFSCSVLLVIAGGVNTILTVSYGKEKNH